MMQAKGISVLVPAAGRGERMGGMRKQYRRLGGETLLLRTVRLFEEHSRIDSMVLAVPAADVDRISSELRHAGLRKIHAVVPGGESRQASVGLALAAVPEASDVILVHDAVRPFLPPDRIGAVIEAVERYGAAALALPLTDTLREASDGDCGRIVPRARLLSMQTPQGFRRDWFEAAHAAARRHGYHETDDAALVQLTGRSVRSIDGSALNMKITTTEDWVLAQALWHYLTTAL